MSLCLQPPPIYDHHNHKTMNHLQKKLFELASGLHKNKRGEMEFYTEVLKLSRSAIYDRINGKIPVSLDEANVLVQALGLSWSQVVAAHTPTQCIRPHALETAPDDYVGWLYKDMLFLAHQKHPHTWHECGAAPVFWFNYSRLLAAFKLYFWLRTFHPHNGGGLPLFTAQWASMGNIGNLLDRTQAILGAYQAVPGLEIWSRQMFDRTIARIQYIREIEGFADEGMAEQLLEEVCKVAQQMERMAKGGNKSPEGKGGEMVAYENRLFAPSNVLVGKAMDGQFLYLDVEYPDFIRYNCMEMVEERVGRFQSMLWHLEPITHSERHCNAFFKGL